MDVLIRCDAGSHVGLGHASRSLALAEELASRLETVPRVLAAPDPLLERFLAGRAVELKALDGAGYGLAEVLEELTDSTVLVSDTYALDERALAAIAATGTIHVVVDDFARVARWPCRVVVNPNVGGELLAYPGAETVLAGPRYALLRGEVRAAVGRRVESDSDEGRRLLVCLGGGAWGAAGDRLLAALAPLAAYGVEVRAALEDDVPPGITVVPQSSLPDQLAWADTALLSGGVVKYEAAAIGVPALLLAVVPHQEGVAEVFARTGAAEYLGPLRTVDAEDVSRAAHELLRDPARRRRLAAAARATVDGRGAERVADVVLRDVRSSIVRDAQGRPAEA